MRANAKHSMALSTFQRSARRMAPTRRHRPALWECMLGTVYAMNKRGHVRYCDYRYAEAVAFIGPHRDVRVSRMKRAVRVGDGVKFDRVLPKGQLVWFVIDEDGR